MLLTLSGTLVVSLLVAGCSSSFEPSSSAPFAGDVGAVSGAVHGGRQPIAGAHIYLLQASTTAYGGASTSLLKSYGAGKFPTTFDGTNYYVTTDANGAFSLNDGVNLEYNACTSGAQVYLYSVQGDTGGHVNNTAAGLMAVLGTCGSFGSSTTVNMNEISTIAAAYAFAGFATDATHVGAASSADALALTGITNAFANAANMFNIGSNPYNAPNTSALATTPGGNGTVPQSLLNFMGDILSACVNTTGPGSTQCSTLFSNVKSAGATGTAATDTATEAIYIAHNPRVAVSTISGIAGTTPSPYTTTYTSAAPPADFVVSLSFTGGGYTTAQLGPRELAIDASGNVWAVNGASSLVVSKFSPLGVPASPTGYISGAGFSQPTGIAVDNGGASANVYVADFITGMVSKFTASTGAYVSAYTITALAGPTDLAIDGSGNIWSADYSDYSVSKHASTGTGNATEYTNGSFNAPQCIAIEPGASGDVYLANYNDGNAFKFNNTTPGTGTVLLGDAGAGGSGNAIDGSGNIWFANFGSVTRLTTANSLATYTSGIGFNEESVAIDGNNNVWVTEQNNGGAGGAVYELSNSTGAVINGSGYVPPSNAQPNSIAIDGSGNVWFNTATDATIRELVGAAVPVATPLAYGVASSKLGAKP
ncbi:MAG: NHL repeat-containing protein [Acidobacteriota bacterium]